MIWLSCKKGNYLIRNTNLVKQQYILLKLNKYSKKVFEDKGHGCHV